MEYVFAALFIVFILGIVALIPIGTIYFLREKEYLMATLGVLFCCGIAGMIGLLISWL